MNEQENNTMYQIDFKKPMAIHFIGIGGISMSGLAEVLLEEGFTISGSDAKESPLTRTLEEKGAKIYYGQRASNISDTVQAVVYTAAIHPDNPEFRKAQEMNLPMLTRAQLLGQIMRNYDTPVAVAGTHGKTTTTSMLSHILLKGDCDPTISVGGILPAIGGNIRVGDFRIACGLQENGGHQFHGRPGELHFRKLQDDGRPQLFGCGYGSHDILDAQAVECPDGIMASMGIPYDFSERG